MRTLLALTALMLVLAGAVWWKTRPVENMNHMPPTTSSDSGLGIATVGMKNASPAEASFPVKAKSDGDADHALPMSPAEDPNAAIAPQPDPAPPVKPTPKPPVNQPLRHTVVQGDTLYSLVSRAYGMAPETLLQAVAEANGLRDPSALDLGQVLILPVLEGFKAPQKP